MVPFATRPPRILIVNHHSDSNRIAEKLIWMHGFDVVSAETLRQAREVLAGPRQAREGQVDQQCELLAGAEGHRAAAHAHYRRAQHRQLEGRGVRSRATWRQARGREAATGICRAGENDLVVGT